MKKSNMMKVLNKAARAQARHRERAVTLEELRKELLPIVKAYRQPKDGVIIKVVMRYPGDYWPGQVGTIFQARFLRGGSARAKLVSCVFRRLDDLTAEELRMVPKSFRMNAGWRGGATEVDVLRFRVVGS